MKGIFEIKSNEYQYLNFITIIAEFNPEIMKFNANFQNLRILMCLKTLTKYLANFIILIIIFPPINVLKDLNLKYISNYNN